jgi:hypothetical protein
MARRYLTCTIMVHNKWAKPNNWSTTWKDDDYTIAHHTLTYITKHRGKKRKLTPHQCTTKKWWESTTLNELLNLSS